MTDAKERLSSTFSRLNLNFEVLVFVERGKPEYVKLRQELTTTSSHL